MKRQCIQLFTLFTAAFLLIQMAVVPQVADALQLQTHQVDIVEAGADPAQWNFDPQRARIAIGDTIRWTNKGSHPHTVTADDSSFDTQLEPGQSFEYTFTQLGTVPYHDKLNPTLTGRVVVQALPAPTDTETAAPTQTPVVVTATLAPTQTPVVVTATAGPSQTPFVVTATPVPPTLTPIIVTATRPPSSPVPLATLTPLPLHTATPTATSLLQTLTPTPTPTPSNAVITSGANMALLTLVILLVVGLSVATIYIIQLRSR